MKSLSYEKSKEIRDSYKILPFQGFWTWLTGKELDGREPLWFTKPWETVIWSILLVAIGIFLTNYGVKKDINYLVILIGTILSVSGARYIVATVIHHAVHQNLLSGKYNKLLAEILSTLFIVQPYDSYYQFHTIEHHGKEFSTLEDKDLTAIYNLGFLPSKSMKQLYFNLIYQCINPIFHIKFMLNRIKSNILGVPRYRLFMSMIYITALIYLMYNMGIVWSLFVIVIPFIFLYQIASLLHLLTEHVWLLRKDSETVRESHYKNSLGRFCGSKCPNDFSRENFFKWVVWSISHIFYHLPVRLLILQGTLTCHDWHHRFGKEKDWANFAYHREKYAKKLHEESKFDLTEIWGFLNAIDYIFKKLSNAEKIEVKNLEYRLN